MGFFEKIKQGLSKTASSISSVFTASELDDDFYDDLEERIEALRAAEELAAIRPDLDGGQIMAELGVAPGPIVGEAYRFLMDLRMEKGPIGEDLARQALRSWWAARQKS